MRRLHKYIITFVYDRENASVILIREYFFSSNNHPPKHCCIFWICIFLTTSTARRATSAEDISLSRNGWGGNVAWFQLREWSREQLAGEWMVILFVCRVLLIRIFSHRINIIIISSRHSSITSLTHRIFIFHLNQNNNKKNELNVKSEFSFFHFSPLKQRHEGIAIPSTSSRMPLQRCK